MQRRREQVGHMMCLDTALGRTALIAGTFGEGLGSAPATVVSVNYPEGRNNLHLLMLHVGAYLWVVY